MFRGLFARWFPPKSLGDRGEGFAARYLKRRGYRIVGRGVDLHVGELDIIAVDTKTGNRRHPTQRTVVFVEVKTRTDHSAGTPAEAVDDHRQQRMTQAALAYLKSHGLLEYPARFDVIALTWPDGAKKPTLEHIQNAFAPTGHGQFFN